MQSRHPLHVLLNPLRRVSLTLVLIGMLVGCGASSASFGGSEAGHVDHQQLNQQAGTLLLSALRDRASESDALRELSMAGVAAVPWLQRALEEQSSAQPADINHALVAELRDRLAARGDQDAIGAIRGAVPSDPIALAIRLRWLAPEDAHAELVAALRHTSERVRLAALRQLRTTSLDAALVLEVTQLARLDPETTIRASAIETLATQGPEAIETLTARLSDSDPLPRSVAMRELARLDCTRAQSLLARWLSEAPSRDSLAAIRALVPCGQPWTTQTLAPLRRALASSDVAVRSEAATTADVYSWGAIPDWVATPLSHDPVPAVRLALANALMPTQTAAARSTLVDLMRAPATMVGVQAAAILASHDNPQALSVLIDARAHDDPHVRRVAFVALGRLPGHSAELAAGLNDPDISVKLASAGALLRATHAML